MAVCPLFLIGLAAAGQAQGPGRHVLGDDGPGSNVRALPHPDRSHQTGVAAYKGAVLQHRLVFVHPVKVGRGNAAANVAILAQGRVAQIS